jgi:hypothetical protein
MKKTLQITLIFMTFLCGYSYAQSQLPACQGNDSRSWSNCNGSITYPNGDRYESTYKDGKQVGQGTYYSLAENQFKGDKYVGEFKDNKFHGQGTYTFANGRKYTGEFKDGKQTGQGVFTEANGNKFVGGFKDGKQDGKGTFTWANGNKLVGEWQDGKYNGQGVFTEANGNKYLGEFKDEKYNGQGTLTFPNGNKYVGEFKDGKQNGQGTFTFASGSKYVGEFRDGKRDGQGTWDWVNGDKFVGQHKGDKYHGQGTLTYAKGDKYVGEFKDNKYHGQGTLTFISGTEYIGEFKDSKYNGKGSLTFSSGNKYVGEFKDGKENGQGTFTYPNGNKYIGEFKDGMQNGSGTYSYSNGEKYVGQNKNNKRDGQGTFYSSNGSIINQGIWADGSFVRSESVQQATATNPSNQTSSMSVASYTQSQLPQCQAGAQVRMSCVGVYIFKNGDKYSGEWQWGERHGLGTLYSSNGSIINQGFWDYGKFIRSESVQQVTISNNEIEKLRAEAELEKRRRQELEEQLRIAQLQTQQSIQSTQSTITSSIGKRVALVVGNNNYKVRPLKNSRNDADDMSRALRNSGFEVIERRDSTLPQMRTAIREFGDKLLTYDVGLVYYSGHGVENKGRNYFIPVNADILREDEIADQGLDVSLILEKMSTAQKSVNILIVDACRDDPFGRTFRSTSKGLAQMDAPRGTIIAYATSPGKVASDGDPRERKSPYTKHLLRAMQAPNKPIEQVFKEVRRAVQDETKNQQTPWENTSLSGDFYFSVKK